MSTTTRCPGSQATALAFPGRPAICAACGQTITSTLRGTLKIHNAPAPATHTPLDEARAAQGLAAMGPGAARELGYIS